MEEGVCFGPQSQRGSSLSWRGGMVARADCSKLREQAGNGVRLWDLKIFPLWHTYPSKATAPRSPQTAPPTGDQGFKCQKLCFSSKLPQKEQKKPVTHEREDSSGYARDARTWAHVCVCLCACVELQGWFCCLSLPGLGLQVCATNTGSFWGAGDPAQVLTVAQQARY